jgi:hypothetical protein
VAIAINAYDRATFEGELSVFLTIVMMGLDTNDHVIGSTTWGSPRSIPTRIAAPTARIKIWRKVSSLHSEAFAFHLPPAVLPAIVMHRVSSGKNLATRAFKVHVVVPVVNPATINARAH